MGSKNRERRRQKQLRREHRRHEGGGRVDPGIGTIPPELVLDHVVDAVHHGQANADELLEGFASGRRIAGGRGGVAACLRSALDMEIGKRRTGGWEPLEVQRVVRQRLGASSLGLLRSAMRTEWRRSGASAPSLDWAREVERFDDAELELDPQGAVWPDDVRATVAVIGVLAYLPSLPRQPGSGSGPAGGPGDDAHRRILERVRGLLAKAEATGFPEEADALTAKAQELLDRHNVDRAALEGAAPVRTHAAASMRRIWIDDPYVPAKANLLHQVASANRCRAVLLAGLGVVVVAGHEDDLDTVELLFTSLLVQATAQLTAAGSRRDASGRSRTRSFRQSFLVAFATRIGQRLRVAVLASEAAAASEHGNRLLPVLASRRSAADEAIETTFTRLEPNHLSANDRLGWAAGTAAADLANLAVQSQLVG
jgi:hypothetical protein